MSRREERRAWRMAHEKAAGYAVVADTGAPGAVS